MWECVGSCHFLQCEKFSYHMVSETGEKILFENIFISIFEGHSGNSTLWCCHRTLINDSIQNFWPYRKNSFCCLAWVILWGMRGIFEGAAVLKGQFIEREKYFPRSIVKFCHLFKSFIRPTKGKFSTENFILKTSKSRKNNSLEWVTYK
jgi:hypothetical protein